MVIKELLDRMDFDMDYLDIPLFVGIDEVFKVFKLEIYK